MFISKRTFFVSFLSHFLVCFVAKDIEEIKNKPGEDVLLQCQASRDADIIMLKWSRPDLKSEGFVYFIRGKHFNEDDQHPSVRGRVELKHPEMKDGDVSVILKNVNINDAGTYECYVGYGGSTELITTINLTVDDSGDKKAQKGDGGNKDGGEEHGGNKSGHLGLTVGLSVVGVLLVAGVGGFVIYRKRKVVTEHKPDPPPADAAAEAFL